MKSYKKLLFVLLTTLMFTSLKSQTQILGDWEGILNTGNMKLKIIIHIKNENNILKSYMDSPDQGAINLPCDETKIIEDSVIITDIKNRLIIRGKYIVAKDSISALFIQRGNTLAINFGRSSIKEIKLNRPQTPKPPFPYSSIEVKFTNKYAGNIKLAGTLTLPNNIKNPPVAILVSGSGPQNRNEKGFDHEPFLILSDYLSRNGVAVLRYDDRGVAESEGNFKTATSYDFSTDAEAAFEYLKTRNDINIKKIGLIGHSEGGMIIPMVAARNKEIAFLISLAGPGVELDKLMLKQIEDLSLSQNEPKENIKKNLDMNAKVFELIKKEHNPVELKNKILSVLNENNYANGDQKSIESFINRCVSPWFMYFIRYNPTIALKEVKCPMLAINGTLDKQVDAKMNLEAIRTALKLGNNQDFLVTYLTGLNHAFQEAKTGNVSEYRLIEHTISPIALETISKWIKERF